MNFANVPLEKLRKQREGLIQYLNDKVDANDWHGVADAAMDLRELDVAIALHEQAQRMPLGLNTDVFNKLTGG